MHASVAGKFSLAVPLTGVEAIKWFGLVCMLQEHVLRFVWDVYPLWSYALGRLAFPLFAIALCRAVDTRSELIVIRRLLVWALISQALRIAFDLEPQPFNVLFTFALGLGAASLWWLGGKWVIVAAGCVALGVFTEYGMAGVLFVVSLRIFLVQWNAAALLLALTALFISQQAYMPLVAFIVAPVLARSFADVPRARGVFYWTYALQWPLIAGFKYVL